jgi:hypothetical protein
VVILERLKMCDNSIEKLAYHLFCGDGLQDTLKESDNYDILQIHYRDRCFDEYACSLSENFTITLNNLKFIPCHRLAYPNFAGG